MFFKWNKDSKVYSFLNIWLIHLGMINISLQDGYTLFHHFMASYTLFHHLLRLCFYKIWFSIKYINSFPSSGEPSFSFIHFGFLLDYFDFISFSEYFFYYGVEFFLYLLFSELQTAVSWALLPIMCTFSIWYVVLYYCTFFRCLISDLYLLI